MSEKLKGLTNEEVKLNHEKFGANTFSNEAQSQFWTVVKGIVFEPLFIILVCTAFIYIILGEQY
jgi:Ca2+-transporting ATPase